MEPSTPDSPGVRVSLRRLLLYFAGVAVACAALKYANPWWEAAAWTVATFSLIVAVIAAMVRRGRAQSTACGYAVAFAVYCALVFGMNGQLRQAFQEGRNAEFDPLEARLPTSRLLGAAYKSIVTIWVLNPRTNERKQWQSQVPIDQVLRGNLGMYTSAEPDGESFMIVGQCLWAVIFGLVGRQFANISYARQVRSTTAPP